METPTIEQLTDAQLFFESHRHFGGKKDMPMIVACFAIIHRAITKLKRSVFSINRSYGKVSCTFDTLPQPKSIIEELFEGVTTWYCMNTAKLLLFDSVDIADEKISDELRNVIRMCAEHKLKVSDVIGEIYAVQYQGQNRRICTKIFPDHKGFCMDDNDSCPLCRIFPGLAANYFNDFIHDMMTHVCDESIFDLDVQLRNIPNVSSDFELLASIRRLYTEHVKYITTCGDPDECKERLQALLLERENNESEQFMAMIQRAMKPSNVSVEPSNVSVEPSDVSVEPSDVSVEPANVESSEDWRTVTRKNKRRGDKRQ